MKNMIKSLMPPLVIDKKNFIKSYFKYLRLKKLLIKNNDIKNIHNGKRCFILGSGPSILKEDLTPLKDEIVFALNNFYVHNNFKYIMQGNVEKYYMTAPIHLPQTEIEWKDWFEDMQKNVPLDINMIFGLNEYKYNTKYILDKYNLFKKHKVSWFFAGKSYKRERFDFTALNISKMIYKGDTVSIYALIYAIYMGFNEIYLLGMDHDYFLYDDEKDMRMYSTAKHQNNELERTFANKFYIEEFFRQYKIFSMYNDIYKNSNVKVYNASTGGILKVFPRVDFKSLF